MVKVLSSFLPFQLITTLLLFCSCLRQPDILSDEMITISPVVLLATDSDHPPPEKVDSIRFTVFSADDKFTDTIRKVFHFDDRHGVLNVPAGSKLYLKVEGLDYQGEVIYRGSIVINDASEDDITIVLDASQVTPRKPSEFILTALSSCNYILTWIDKSNNETGFIIQHRTADVFTTLDTVKSGITTFLHSSMQYKDFQVYRIFAFNDAGTSDTLTDSIKSPLINNINQAPQFLQNSQEISGTLYLDQTKKIIIKVIDPDCDDFKISVCAKLNSSADTIFWTPNIHDIGKNDLWVAATDNSNATDTLFWTWEVKDTIRPIITLKEPDTIRLALNDRFVEPGAKAYDNVDGDISEKIVLNQTVNTSHIGTYPITYSVSDQFENQAIEKTRIVYVLPGLFPDRVPPVIFLIGADTIVHNIGKLFTDPGAYALDNRDDSTSINEKLTSNGKVDTTLTGTYQIIYKVRDNSGNEAVQVRYVKITDISNDNQTAIILPEARNLFQN